jgi:RNA polymerase sigma-70 factor (ECF subfamily)
LVDYLRKHSDSRLDKDLLRISMEKMVPSAEAALVQASAGKDLLRFMEKLSAEHREVLTFAYFQELSIKEIAVMLRISENTVKTRMFYARQKMKKILQGAGILSNEYESD